jgi:hypothetical protein
MAQNGPPIIPPQFAVSDPVFGTDRARPLDDGSEHFVVGGVIVWCRADDVHVQVAVADVVPYDDPMWSDQSFERFDEVGDLSQRERDIELVRDANGGDRLDHGGEELVVQPRQLTVGLGS